MDPAAPPADLTREQQRWLEENADGLAAYNARIEEHGLFSDGLRGF